LLFIPLAIYIPNPGGIGLSLPFNLLVYGGAALLMGGLAGNTTVPEL
jgi:O-antigen polymerase